MQRLGSTQSHLEAFFFLTGALHSTSNPTLEGNPGLQEQFEGLRSCTGMVVRKVPLHKWKYAHQPVDRH